MTEQELADRFSDQVDRMLEGQPPEVTAEVDDLADLLSLSEQLTQTQFQAGPAAQAAFLDRLADWFGHAMNGETPMTLFGLTKSWLISIIAVIIIAAGGIGIIVLVGINIFSPSETAQLPDTATPTATVEASETPVVTDTPTATATPDAEETPTSTPEPTVTPVMSDTVSTWPLLIFVSDLSLPSLCGGVYSTQQVLVNYSDQPIDQAALVWEVIEGADLVDDIAIGSDTLIEIEDDAETVAVNLSEAAAPENDDDLNYASFDTIAANQEVKLDVKVKVKEKWWKNEGETKIKVKLSVANRIETEIEQEVEFDDRHISNHSQIITIVRQDAQWVTLRGFLHHYHGQTYLVDGNVVTIGDCTAFPENLPLGAFVEIVGLLQPDGTFIAINIIVDVNIIVIGDFDSGVPVGSGDDDGGSQGGGSQGGSHGGSKGGSKGGSHGGSKGGSRD